MPILKRGSQKKASEATSTKAAKAASEMLRDPHASKAAKSASGSALTQRSLYHYVSAVKPSTVVKELTSEFDLTAKTMAGVIGVTPRTFSRWSGNNHAMSEQQADRLNILKSILDLGKSVLGSEEAVKKWIHQPILLLDGQIPADIIDTESGRRKIESVLHQIEFGFF